MHRIPVTPAVLALFRERRIFLRHPNDQTPPPQWIGFHDGCAVEAYSHVMFGNWLAFRMGAFSYAHSQMSPFISVGRFCSISSEVSWISEGHPIDWVTSYPLTYDQAPLPAVSAFFEDHGVKIETEFFQAGIKLTQIEHDVWIGQCASIMPGVKIGVGAIVAAGALVVNDVAPYTIVGGVPAKPLRRRFNDELVERLLRSEWWRYSPKDFGNLKMRKPEAFLDRFEDLKPSIAPLDLSTLSAEQLLKRVGSLPE